MFSALLEPGTQLAALCSANNLIPMARIASVGIQKDIASAGIQKDITSAGMHEYKISGKLNI